MMTATAIRRIELRGLDRQILADAPSPYLVPQEARLYAALLGQSWFNDELIDALSDLRLGRGPAALQIGGVPAGPTKVSTPDASGPFDDGHEWSSEACLLGLAYYLGVPYSYHREHNGAVIQQVVALRNRAGVQSSEGSDTPLGFHTENSFAATRPDYVLLLCRRSGPVQVPTFVLDAEEVIGCVPSATAEMLARPIYSVRSPASFGDPIFVSGDVRVVEPSAARTALRFDLENLLTSEDTGGSQALREIFAATKSAGSAVLLDECDVLVIDNRRAAHARPSFRTLFDGNQRWLQRCLVRAEFWSCRSAILQEGIRII